MAASTLRQDARFHFWYHPLRSYGALKTGARLTGMRVAITIAVSSSVLDLKRKLEAPLEVPVLSQELIFRIMPLMLLAAFAWRAFRRDNGGGIHSTGIWLFVHIYDTVGASSRVFVQAVGVRVFKATTQ